MSWNWRIVFKIFNYALLSGNYPEHAYMKGKIAIGYNRPGLNMDGEKHRWWSVLWEIK